MTLLPTLLVVIICAGLLSALLIVLLRPLLQRYALARPNARSSHTIPTPQGGGIAVILAALVVSAFGFVVLPDLSPAIPAFAGLAGGAIALGLVGAVDDIRPLPPLLRLVFQLAAVALAIVVAGDGALFPVLPHGIELLLVVLGGVWFVNLVNFMDGLDWISVAEMTPVTAALAVFALAGWLDPASGLIAAGLLGGMLGFAPFNKPVARLFLGDVGSLPIGLIAGFLLYRLALEGGMAAAILLPLYHLMDATITLLRRLRRGEKVWEAHRSHFYQQATANGWPVIAVSQQVFMLNIVLAILAALSLAVDHFLLQSLLVALGFGLTGLVLLRFAKPYSRKPA